MPDEVKDEQGWGFWRVTKDLKRFRWIDPKTSEPKQMFDIEVEVAKDNFKGVTTRLKREIAAEGGSEFGYDEVRIISSLENAKNDIVDGMTIWDRLKIG